MDNKGYTEQLEGIIKGMMQSFKNIPFSLIIDEISKHKVISFDNTNKKHIDVLEKLKQVGQVTIKLIDKKGGIIRERANEVGNDIEKYVRDAFHQLCIEADIPADTAGHKKSVGYPDIRFTYNDIPYYLECKTYNKDNLNTTLRAFYFSPSEKSKITVDTIHFMVSFEIEKKVNAFYARNFKIISLENLELNIKYEFNSDNKKMYSNQNGAKILYESDK